MTKPVSIHGEAIRYERHKTFYFSMSTPASDEIPRLRRLEGQVLGIAESVPHMQEELERLRAKMVELAPVLSAIREGQVNFSDFLELGGTVGRLQAETNSLRARIDISSTLSRGPAEGSRTPMPVYSSDRITLSNFLKLFQTWTLLHEAGNALVTEDPIRVVGRERSELESTHDREKVNQSTAVWTGLVKRIEKGKTLVDMVITAGSPSEAWKILLSLVSESSKAAQDRVKKELKELYFEVEGGGGARRDATERDGKGHQPHHQQQWASQPLVQYQQRWASQPPAQRQQPQKHQRQPQKHQQQPQQHQRQPQQQQQRLPVHPGGWGPSRFSFRCGQPGHFYAECRAVPPAPLNPYPLAPYITPQDGQQSNYSATSIEITRLLRENMDT